MSSLSRSAQEDGSGPMIQLGRSIPVVLVKAIQDDLLEKVTGWLKANGAPDEVCQAVETANALQLFAGKKEAGTLSDLDAEALPASIVEASNLALKFGGLFLDGWVAGEAQIPVWNITENA
jgi:hypothetical protein